MKSLNVIASAAGAAAWRQAIAQPASTPPDSDATAAEESKVRKARRLTPAVEVREVTSVGV